MSAWTPEDEAAWSELVDRLTAEGQTNPDGSARLLCSIWGGPRAALANFEEGKR